MYKRQSREIYEELGVSRTTFKEWVYNILDRKQDPYDNNPLEFDEHEIKKLWQIRFYKQLKYSNAQIRELLATPTNDIETNLEQQIIELTKQKEELEKIIAVATAIKETGITPYSLQLNTFGFEKLKYNDTLSAINLLNNYIIGKVEFNEISICDEDLEKLETTFNVIIELNKKGVLFSAEPVQRQVQIIHKTISKEFSSSIILFSNIIQHCSPNQELGNEIDFEYGKGNSAFFYDALQYYCDQNVDNTVDNNLISACNSLKKLAYQKHSTHSIEIQNEIKKLDDFFSQFDKHIKSNIPYLQLIGNMIGSEEFKTEFDNGENQGIAWFVARAIEIYFIKKAKDTKYYEE